MPDFDTEGRQAQFLFIIIVLVGTVAGMRQFLKGSTDFIKIRYLVCGKNEDCMVVPDACSCSCGAAINRAVEEDFNKNFDKQCVDFNGPKCDMKCDEDLIPVCKWGKCRLEE